MTHQNKNSDPIDRLAFKPAENKKNSNEHSMASTLRRHAVVLALILTVPLLFMLFAIRLTLQNYDRVISNVDGARQLKNSYVEKLDQEIWLIVSGRKTPEEGIQHELISDARTQIASLLAVSTDQSKQYLTAAERSILSAEHYVNELEQQIFDEKSARTNTKLHEEISSICLLTGEVLDDYIEEGNQQIADWNRRIQRAFIYLIVMILLLIITAALMTASISRKMAKDMQDPILELENFAGQIANGSLETRVVEPQLLELKPLSRDLNAMAVKLNYYFEDKLNAETNMRKAELKALQAQIQPHFIYNTLGTIVWLAEQERYQDVIDMTMAFTKFLRLSLSGGEEIITVEVEVEHVKSYLEIQRFRYGKKITYDISIDPEILQLPILKFTLQPLVENAIYHGIKGKRYGQGNISISGILQGEQVIFSVKDTGQGIDPERLLDLRERLAKVTRDQTAYASQYSTSTDKGGYGLINVASRLWLYYGCKLEIDGKPGEGALVSFAYNRKDSLQYKHLPSPSERITAT